MRHTKKILTGLNHTQYEHPFDKKALEALEATPGLTAAGRYVTSQTIERIYTVQYTGSHLRITKDSYPQIYEYMEYACQVLDVKRIPEMYLQWGFGIDSFTIGSDHPIVVLNSGFMDLCDDDEKLFLLGHELGHIKSDHMLYHMLAQLINYIIDLIPGGMLVGGPLRYALLYWDRMSEFTADRAGLLCCQNVNAVIRVYTKKAGLPQNQFSKLNAQAFLQQAKDFDIMDYEKLNKLFKFISIAGSDQPWTVMRAAELIKWIEQGEYDRFLKDALPDTNGNISSKLNRIK